MANLSERLPDNVCGRYYVDGQCIACDQCRGIAPAFFARHPDTGSSYVQRQPSTPGDVEQFEQAMASCPCQAIGADGA